MSWRRALPFVFKVLAVGIGLGMLVSFIYIESRHPAMPEFCQRAYEKTKTAADTAQVDQIRVTVHGETGATSCGVFRIEKSAPALLKSTKCMLNVLTTTPGVSGAKLEITDRAGWTQPFLYYHSSDKLSWGGYTEFDLQRPSHLDLGPYEFNTVLPGMITPGTKLPDAPITWAVMKAWRTRCAVDVGVAIE